MVEVEFEAREESLTYKSSVYIIERRTSGNSLATRFYRDGNYAETVTANKRDQDALDKVIGIKKTYELNCNNHMMDNIARSELRQRFIFLFRLLKADIITTYDPTGHYEENPDHYVTSACGDKDYPEHFDAGLKPYSVKEKYYFARFQQQVNRVIEIAPWVETKIDANLENKAQGPAGETGARLRRKLLSEGKTLPLIGYDARGRANWQRAISRRRTH